MIFQNKHSTYKDLNITIDGTIVKQVHTVKFLGLLIDSHLTWKPQIDHLCSKISKIIGVLYKIKHFVPPSVLKILYNSLIFCNLSYCNIVWGNTYFTYLNRLFMLQKRAIRLITSSHYSSNTSSLLSELNTLSLYDIYKYQMGSFMYKIYHNSLPPKFCNLFQLNSSFHNHFTRHCNDYHLHSVNSIINKRSFVFTGIQFWNLI